MRAAVQGQCGDDVESSCPVGEGERRAVRVQNAEVRKMAFERSAIGHLLAAGNARLLHPRQHKPLREAALGHARDVSSPKKRGAREVVLQRENPGALLQALRGDAVDERLAHGD